MSIWVRYLLAGLLATFSLSTFAADKAKEKSRLMKESRLLREESRLCVQLNDEIEIGLVNPR